MKKLKIYQSRIYLCPTISFNLEINSSGKANESETSPCTQTKWKLTARIELEIVEIERSRFHVPSVQKMSVDCDPAPALRYGRYPDQRQCFLRQLKYTFNFSGSEKAGNFMFFVFCFSEFFILFPKTFKKH